MGLFDKFFKKKNEESSTFEKEHFWAWFSRNSEHFYEIIEKGVDVEHGFVQPISEKLNEVNDQFYFLAGLGNDKIAELIITPEGMPAQIAAVEDFVTEAPQIPNWRFIALKPKAINSRDIDIKMNQASFNHETLSFYDNTDPYYPDEINIGIVHPEYTEENKTLIANGSFIFLDNYLGELNAVTLLDTVEFNSTAPEGKELIAIDKLEGFIHWRVQEFEEKYEGTRYDTENDTYSSLEAELSNGLPLVGIFNTTLLNWDSKASHPWILKIELKYDGSGNNGFPNKNLLEKMNLIEDEIQAQLKDKDGYLNIGRQTADGVREIFFACKEFRKPSSVLNAAIKEYSSLFKTFRFEIFKDKYWQSLEAFNVPIN